jgi:hypothetical protein
MTIFQALTEETILGCKNQSLTAETIDECELIDSIAAFIKKCGSVRKAINVLDSLTKNQSTYIFSSNPVEQTPYSGC